MAEKKLTRREAVDKALYMCSEAVHSLTNANTIMHRNEQAADISIGAARSYLEEAYGLLEQLRIRATVPKGQNPDDEGFKA